MRPSFLPCGSMIHSPPAPHNRRAFRIHLHAIRDAGLITPQVHEDPVGLLREGAIGQQIKSPDVAAPGVVNIEYASSGEKARPLGNRKSSMSKVRVPRSGVNTVHTGKREIPLLGRQGTGPGSVK